MKISEEHLISRGLDGALNDRERAALDALIARNPEAAARTRAWSDIGDQLRRQATATVTPDPLAAWHDIRRAIRTQAAPEREEALAMGWSMFRLRIMGAITAVAVIGLLGWSSLRLFRGGDHVAATSPASNRVEWVVAEIPGATTMIYTDAETDLTVIWMDLAQNVDPRDT